MTRQRDSLKAKPITIQIAGSLLSTTAALPLCCGTRFLRKPLAGFGIGGRHRRSTTSLYPWRQVRVAKFINLPKDLFLSAPLPIKTVAVELEEGEARRRLRGMASIARISSKLLANPSSKNSRKRTRLVLIISRRRKGANTRGSEIKHIHRLLKRLSRRCWTTLGPLCLRDGECSLRQPPNLRWLPKTTPSSMDRKPSRASMRTSLNQQLQESKMGRWSMVFLHLFLTWPPK